MQYTRPLCGTTTRDDQEAIRSVPGSGWSMTRGGAPGLAAVGAAGNDDALIGAVETGCLGPGCEKGAVRQGGDDQVHVVLVHSTAAPVVFLRHINDEIGLGAAGFLLEDGASYHTGYASCSTLSETPSTMSLTFSL